MEIMELHERIIGILEDIAARLASLEILSILTIVLLGVMCACLFFKD